MKNKLATVILLSGSLLIPLAGYTDDMEREHSSPKTWVKDSVITTKIKADLAKDKNVSAMHIKVDTDDMGAVQLSGTAKTQAEADRAVEIARGVKGVVSVDNKITVNPDR